MTSIDELFELASILFFAFIIKFHIILSQVIADQKKNWDISISIYKGMYACVCVCISEIDQVKIYCHIILS